MTKIIVLFLLVLALKITPSHSQTTLTAGDIAITGYNTDGDDQVAFVLLTDITVGTEIRFTDRGWLDTNAFRIGNTGREGTLIWVADTDLSCGSQIILTSANDGTLTISPNIGSLTEVDDFEIRGQGDQILAYQGTDDSPTFIYALNFNNPGWSTTAGNQQESALPIGLTDGVNSVDISGDIDNGTYNCAVTTLPDAILASVSDAANWNTSDGDGNQSLTLGQCLFSCTSIIQTVLTAGDIVITGYNTDGNDQVAFVLLTDITAGTEIRFTDRGWLDTDAFRVGNTDREGTLIWTANTDLSCGTQIILTSANNGTLTISPNTGILTEEDDFEIRGQGDQILAYQGTDDSPTFIYALNFNNPGWSVTAGNQQESALPIGLADGVNSVDISGDIDNGAYDCAVTTSPELILTAVSDATNWDTSDGGGNQSLTLGLCTFDCSVICPTTTTWNGTTWDNGIPNTTVAAIINGAYTTGVNGNISACSLAVNSGFRLSISNSTFIEIESDVVINGEIIVESSGNFVQNIDSSTYTNNGAMSRVNKVTPVKQDWFFFTYWSSPVSGLTVDDVFATNPANRRFIFNANNYLDLNEDGFDDDANAYELVSGSDPLIPGVGYAITENQQFFIPGSTAQATFDGTFNNGLIEVPIAYDSANVAHYNFIGNPYPSAIDFEIFQATNSSLIGGIAYLWSQSTPPSANNPGNQTVNFSQNDYATYTIGSGGAAGASGIIPTQYIPSGQGFFIPSVGAGNAVFKNSMRVASIDSNNQFFGTEENSLTLNSNPTVNSNDLLIDNENKIWINLKSDNGIFNQILVAYVGGATDAYDGFSYDAPRVLPIGTSAILYTFIEDDEDDIKFVIQGKDINSINENEIIHLGFETNIEVPTLYTLSLDQFEGAFIENSTIFLKDNLLDVMHNLSEGDYEFTSEVGTFEERFQIQFVSETLSIDENLVIENELVIIELNNNDVQFKVSGNLEMESIKIIDLNGRVLYNFKAQGSDNTYNLSKLNNSVYIAQIRLTNGVLISKKALKRN
ncbi:T9SS C-terminal target domain-containing protein [Flavobacteriaceae bacterium AU392]|nr:T9SS C-terminal target domain-containing protein [Flavobacteriaceae bacterium]RKM84681.1 T9SS C-terminal target domain-containing protein [Flavobacteriaceae bacterium AU392]